jgi:hypothetical protein
MAGDTIKFLIEMRDSASGPLKKVGKAADQSARSANTATTKYTELSSKLHLLGVAASAAKTAVLAVAKPMNMLARGGIEAGAQMEGFETRLKVLMGSSSDARDRLDELFKIGSTTPFELPGLMEAEVNLRALGVNAEETLPLVMDFAGAMKIDVARAAVEVGRAMQFGAGAVETIAGRSLRAQVELRTGADALKMSTSEFREELIKTLTDPGGMFKGGTEELAATFDGMMSNLRDSWFKFKKEIGEAGAFVVAKEILSSILTVIADSQEMTGRWAKVISAGVVKGMLLTLEIVGRILETSNGFSKAWTLAGVAFDQLIIKSEDINRSIKKMILSAGEFTGLMSDDTRLRMERQIVESYKESGAARERIQKAMFDQLPILEQEEAKLRKIRAESERISENLESIIRGAEPEDEKAGRALPAPKAEGAGAAKGQSAQELEDAMSASLRGASSSLKELEHLLYLLSPAGLAEGMVNKLSEPMKTMTEALGPAGGLVNSLSAIGQMGSKAIVDGMKEAIRGVITALVEVVPDLIVEIPRMLMHLVPELVEGLVMAIPEILQALIIELPAAFFNGLMKWWRKIWATIQNFFMPGRKKRKERLEMAEEAGVRGPGFLKQSVGMFLQATETVASLFRGKKQTGAAHIDRSGFALVHQGEAIIPSNGANAQSVAGRMGRGGGVNVHISTNVVDTNAIRGLGKLLEREFGSFGRSTSPVFNSPTGSRG